MSTLTHLSDAELDAVNGGNPQRIHSFNFTRQRTGDALGVGGVNVGVNAFGRQTQDSSGNASSGSNSNSTSNSNSMDY